MSSLKRKPGIVVCEKRGTPPGGRVAHNALMRKSSDQMRRNRRLRIICLMTHVAIGGAAFEKVVAMTLTALCLHVGTGERERRCRVVVSSAPPRCRFVAIRTLNRKAGGRMGRIGGSLIFIRVAGRALANRCLEVPPSMAGTA